MDWSFAIDLNRQALLRVIAALLAMAGLESGDKAPETLPRHVRQKILKILRPAESALRRLIYIAARIIGTQTPKSRATGRRFPAGGIPRGDKTRAPLFPLFDSRKEFAELSKRPLRSHQKRGPGPRISSFDDSRWSAYQEEVLSPDDEMNAAALRGRLHALNDALQDIPKQAKRMVRAEARRRLARPGPRRVGPLRGGYPPGHRKRHIHEVDGILYECHALAMIHPRPPDLTLDMFSEKMSRPPL